MKDKQYDFSVVESLYIDLWDRIGVYKFRNDSPRSSTFVIDTPPPTVSGNLHIGHTFSYTHTDVIARYKRMVGYDVFYPIGFDDNGLPTERLVEKKIGLKAGDVKRKEFVKLCKEVVMDEETLFRSLFKKTGFSFDWSLEYQTISDTTATISQMSFLDLVEKSYVYRSMQPILWDTVDQTAIAQSEVEDREFLSHMNNIRFFSDDGREVIIATTRPELLPGCVGVFYHPEDERYRSFDGRRVMPALVDTYVPIIADERVDPSKGTGLVMCCTFGDMTDVLWWREYKLPLKQVITRNGTLDCKNTIEGIHGLYVKDARRKVVDILSSHSLMVSQQEIKHTVKCAERSRAPLEILATQQWFIKTLEYKDKMLDLSKSVNWHPSFMQNKLDAWINSLSIDWCISRQRFFGVPIPVWYSKRSGEEGRIIYPERNQLPIDPTSTLPNGYSKDEVEPDYDVFDTWATSCVSPQINSLGISDSYYLDLERHKKIFPADLRPQSHEIIRTWSFGTILKSFLHAKTLPWKNIAISGWCLSEDKTKMSKSKGNIIDPNFAISRYGVDVVRYWASSARLGVDSSYSEDLLKQGKRVVNKIWNAAKFISRSVDKIDKDSCISSLIGNKVFCTMDLYILNKLSNTIQIATELLEKYEYSLAKDSIERFFFDDFCDNYLEVIKTRYYSTDSALDSFRISASNTAYWCMYYINKLWAPYLPFVTEAVYQDVFCQESGEFRSVHERDQWPRVEVTVDHDLQNIGSYVIEVLDYVRKFKSSLGLHLNGAIKLHIKDSRYHELPFDALMDIKNVCCADDFMYEFIPDNKEMVITCSKI